MYNFLLDKLEDERDKRNESDDDSEEEDEEVERDDVLCALKQSINKIKQYYALTGGLIYTVATGKFYSLYFYMYLFII